MTHIGDEAFAYCKGLQSIELPSSVTIIDNSTFFGCSGLQSVRILHGVIEIGEWAFLGCESLQSIEIPSSVTSIGDRAFLKCKNLSSLTLHYKEPIDLSPKLVAELPISDKITLHVPVGTGDAYRHHLEFSKVKEVIDNVR